MTQNTNPLPLLPWEADTPADQLDALMAEYTPVGPTETALVERLAWLMARRARLMAAEHHVHMRDFNGPLIDFDESSDLAEAVGISGRTGGYVVNDELPRLVDSGPKDDAEACADSQANLKATQTAITILGLGWDGAYDLALDALSEDTREWWQERLEDDSKNVEANTSCLLAFLSETVNDTHRAQADVIALRPVLRQAVRARSFNPDAMTTLLEIDSRLDRQMEKALSMLLKLQERRLGRQTRVSGPAQDGG